MLRQARSTSSKSNPSFTAMAPAGGGTKSLVASRAGAGANAGGNVAWLEGAIAELGETLAPDDACILLLGGADALAFRLRVAQSHLRPDMLPSYWSESVLLERRGANLARARVIHVPLVPPDGEAFPPDTNGVVSQPLRDFDDAEKWPNIALMGLPVKQADVLDRVEAFKKSRSTLDALEHCLRWLAFSWGVAKTGNPLNENYGLPSACMLETACAGARLDLTPGLESRASCPEAIWIAARFWQDYFEKFHEKAIVGRYRTSHSYPIFEAGSKPAGRSGVRK